MRIASFTIKNYRSINEAAKIPLQPNTVLIGPNNQGKSNILRALALAMHEITAENMPRRPSFRARTEGWHYDPEIDLPRNKKVKTSVDLEFELDADETREFKSEIKSAINGILLLTVTFDKPNDNSRSIFPRANIKILKQGRGGVALNSKTNKILKFIASRIQFQYIPAVRTASSSSDVVERIVGAELKLLESNSEYLSAIQKIQDLQRPVLEQISSRATKTLKRFAPDIKAINFSIDQERRYNELRRSIQISVDDGVVTSLDQKGDGIQSLVALGIRHHASESSRQKQTYIFAIEEPEAHLHSNATHELKRVIDEISTNDQVIISTHSTVFVNRSDLKCNIIVNKNRATVAKKIQEVRDVLGVRSSENLAGAELVLLVEGQNDKTALVSWLRNNSSNLNKALIAGRLIVEELRSASKLQSHVQFYKSILCSVHCFLDNDQESKSAFVKARSSSLLLESDACFAKYPGLIESELEDFIDMSLYKDKFAEEFTLDLNLWRPRQKRKWSTRIGEFFESKGRNFDDTVLMKAKHIVVSEFEKNPIIVNEKAKDIMSNLAAALEKKLSV